jgi:hypothetical protein
MTPNSVAAWNDRAGRRPAQEPVVRAVPCLLACLITTGWAPAVAGAESALAPMQVSARVLPHVRLEQVEPVTTTVTLTAADVANGYVDVVQRYTLRTNAPERVRLRFQPRAAYARSVTIEGVGATVHLHDEPVEWSPAPDRDLSFALRLWLAPGLQPGDYPSPVQVVAVVD